MFLELKLISVVIFIRLDKVQEINDVDGEHIWVDCSSKHTHEANKGSTETPNLWKNVNDVVHLPSMLIPEIMHEKVQTHDLFVPSFKSC